MEEFAYVGNKPGFPVVEGCPACRGQTKKHLGISTCPPHLQKQRPETDSAPVEEPTPETAKRKTVRLDPDASVTMFESRPLSSASGQEPRLQSDAEANYPSHKTPDSAPAENPKVGSEIPMPWCLLLFFRRDYLHR